MISATASHSRPRPLRASPAATNCAVAGSGPGKFIAGSVGRIVGGCSVTGAGIRRVGSGARELDALDAADEAVDKGEPSSRQNLIVSSSYVRPHVGQLVILLRYWLIWLCDYS